ncbi:MAG: transglycosylase domain-containing protein, partial [Gilliamella sp.]|nr:transglycosylase domain-containing protein [Gilliamella sp.]
MKSLFKKVLRTIKEVIIGFMLLSVLLVVLMRWVNPLGSMLMVERKIVHWNMTQQRTWKDWDQISDNIKIAVIAAEDQKFSNHWGFDFKAM